MAFIFSGYLTILMLATKRHLRILEITAGLQQHPSRYHSTIFAIFTNQ